MKTIIQHVNELSKDLDGVLGQHTKVVCFQLLADKAPRDDAIQFGHYRVRKSSTDHESVTNNTMQAICH